MGWKRSTEEKRRLKKLAESHPAYIHHGGAWFDDDKNRYVRTYSPPCAKAFRVIINRRIRRGHRALPSRPGGYRKPYEYLYEII